MPNSEQSPATSRGASPTPSATESRRSLTTPAGAGVPAPVQQALPLCPPATAEIPSRAVRPHHLWLGIHCPALPLDALHRPGKEAAEQATAVFEEQQGLRRILLANALAQSRGIAAGLSVNAALALVPTLDLKMREPDRETRALQDLAGRAGRFTSRVNIEMPGMLLLEIAGSLRLFGGSERLWQRIEADFVEHGFTVSLAIAPTPLAAAWLAKAGTGACLMDMKHLTGALASLPLPCLDWPASVCESLNGMGITSIGDCLRLPRAGFARRFGAARLLQLDRALGRLPDPRPGHRAPERFCREYELTEELSDRELLLAACHRLLELLERFLTVRQAAVQRLRFSFFHLKGSATHLVLGCLEPDRSARRWFELLGMKFERLVLPEPVIVIRLQGGRLQPWHADTDRLPLACTSPAGQERTPPVAHLVERLAARIGDDRVHGVTAVAEHRPHYAWSTVRAAGNRIPQCAMPDNAAYEHCAFPQLAGMRRTSSLLLRRPLWMLAEPLNLAVERELPHYHGPLRLEQGPERLETGWWDGNGIARDYFVAVNPQGAHLWVYRDRSDRARPAGWYLHGIFA